MNLPVIPFLSVMDQCVFGDLCRLCLDKSDKFMNIFGEEGQQLQVKDKLTTLFPFEVIIKSGIQYSYGLRSIFIV